MWNAVLLTLMFGPPVVAGIRALRGQRRVRLWDEAASSCGLRTLDSASSPPHLLAQRGPVDVQFENSGSKGRLTRITVTGPGSQAFRELRICRESLLLSTPEIEIGDESFDSTFHIEGPMRLACALLDPAMRQLLLRVNADYRLEISYGVLQARYLSDQEVPGVLALLLDIGKRIAQVQDVPQHLMDNAGQDPGAGVRLQNLLVLIHELPSHPETSVALHRACSDTSPEIRLRAAKALGAEGRSVLLELAESEVDDAVSAEAVSILDRELPFERARAILDHALGKCRTLTARACLKALGRSGVAAAVDALASVMADEKGELAAAAAQALGTTENLAAEPPLILALQREQADLRVAAATALGRVGSVAAVPPLKEATERAWLDRDLRQATRQAVAEIQSRVQGASPGQLSIAGAEAGQL